jgi:putative copper export protein
MNWEGVGMNMLALVFCALALICIFIMLCCAGIRLFQHIMQKEKPERLLSFREEKLWLCVLAIMLLTSRYCIMYLYLFQNDPNPALNDALVRQYLFGLFVSLVWPIQLPDLVGSIVILAINRTWKRRSGASAKAIRFHKALFICACVGFLLLVTYVSALYRLEMLSLESAYTRFLFGKCLALVLIVISLKEECGTGDGTASHLIRHN